MSHRPAHDPSRVVTMTREAFMALVTVTEAGCWEWNGYRYHSGHGRLQRAVDGGRWRASRYAYTLFRKPPGGLHVLHHCDNPPCVNPDHLYLGTNVENQRDMVERGQHWQANKTHCKRGHEFTSENTQGRSSGRNGRTCRACHIAWTAAWRAKKAVGKTHR